MSSVYFWGLNGNRRHIKYSNVKIVNRLIKFLPEYFLMTQAYKNQHGLVFQVRN